MFLKLSLLNHPMKKTSAPDSVTAELCQILREERPAPQALTENRRGRARAGTRLPLPSSDINKNIYNFKNEGALPHSLCTVCTQTELRWRQHKQSMLPATPLPDRAKVCGGEGRTGLTVFPPHQASHLL